MQDGQLREQDFVTLAPGKAFNPFQAKDDKGFFGEHQIRPENFGVPGDYTVRYFYSTEGWEAGGRGIRTVRAAGEAIDAMRERIGRVPKLSVKSNVVNVTVIESVKK